MNIDIDNNNNNNNNNNNMDAPNRVALDRAAIDRAVIDRAAINIDGHIIDGLLHLVFFHKRGKTNFPNVGKGELDVQTVANHESLLRMCLCTMEATLSQINTLTGMQIRFPPDACFQKKLGFLHGCLSLMGFDTTGKTVYQLYRLIRDFNDRLAQKVEEINLMPDFPHPVGERKRIVEDNGPAIPRPYFRLLIRKSPNEAAALSHMLDFLSEFPQLLGIYNYRRLVTEFLNPIPERETSEEIRGPIETGLKNRILIISDCTAKRIATRCNNLEEALAMWESLKSFINDNI